MASSKGIIRFEGKLGDLVFYSLNGKPVVRMNDLSRAKKIKNDAAFVRVRESNQEFGIAAHLSKVIRTSILHLHSLYKDSSTHSRLNGVIKRIIVLGAGKRGLRSFEVSKCGQLAGFEWNSSSPFSQYYSGSFSSEVNSSGLCCLFEGNSSSIYPYSGATHVKFSVGVLSISDFVFVSSVNSYSASGSFGDYAHAESDFIPLDAPFGCNICIPSAVFSHGSPFLLFCGISFFQFLNGSFYRLEGGGLRVVEVRG